MNLCVEILRVHRYTVTMDKRPIGIFDSGMGGLTVMREIVALLPQENIIYFGDNGRLPYGTKSTETVIKYTFQDIRFLMSLDVKLIVIACNTASACSYDIVHQAFDVPIIEVIQAAAGSAVRYTRNRRIGVIGTTATINSGVYNETIHRLDADIRIVAKACPLFVPLVEEGWVDTSITHQIIAEYLSPLRAEGLDTLVLGCTHYPLLQSAIQQVLGEDIRLINSAKEVALTTESTLKTYEMANASDTFPVYHYYTSDSVDKFRLLGGAFLNQPIGQVDKVDIESY